MNLLIGEISEVVPEVQATTSNQIINQLFTELSKIQGIVVTEKKIPIAIVTKTGFYQQLGTLYGYNLYIGRSVGLLMKKEILSVDYFTPILSVSEKAMNREEEHLYDYVIVTKDEQYYGVVSIRTLMITLATIQSKMATYMNPLTELPGNQIIYEKLNQVLVREAYTLLYIDLDNFKTYNDVYGFSKGDHVLQETASLLKKYINSSIDFLGHIGGDDFVAILYHHDYDPICRTVINEFDQKIKKFYSDKHHSQGYVTSENRSGIKEKIPLVSISIAVITNQERTFDTVEEIVSLATKTKKSCKSVTYSCYIKNTCCS
ncbi:GGDEF domain-containing protein [Litchfieldia salsa]|uniref:Diguanylate cyclase (GGDEF) domain-containing protein n=1 Tax=Litchfieldia salsa TaxID=930152 RepID=A0A1H0T8V1_9BACI|nr:GGDEF domain-containing protein [Litchfieldia salsa]SDP50120.1 diguanylate cyclase (GGDEF) domain-containing protein [Litchfieldia salsa]